MSYKGFKILAVIPARGGSKGIPRKNLCTVAGVSLVGHAAKAALSLDWIDRTVLSTDDDDIAAEGQKYGATVPFRRPADLASDRARSTDMWKHAWLASEDHFEEKYDISILLEPTSPLRRPEDIQTTVKTLIENDCDAAATFSRAPAHFTPHKPAVQHPPENPGLLFPQWNLLCRKTPHFAGKRDDYRGKLQGSRHRTARRQHRRFARIGVCGVFISKGLSLTLSKLNCLQPDMYFSNPGDLTAYLNGNSGRAIDVDFKISLQPHK